MSYIENLCEDSIERLTWKTLYHRGSTPKTPFELILTDSKTPLICTDIIRLIPKKRLVAFGTWNNKPVVAKLFYERGKKAKYHCDRDARGIHSLVAENVPTPAILYQGSADKKRIQVLLFEKISPSFNLDEIWRDKVCIDELLPLMHGVIFELATQHVLGILQRDLHLKNFLISQKKIYTLDGDRIEKFDAPLSKSISLENLGLFFAQLGVGTKKYRDEFFRYYAKLRSWIVTKADITALNTAYTKTNQQRWQNYEKKIFRNCTAFKKIAKPGQFIMFDRTYESPEFLHFLKNPDSAFSDEKCFLKKGRSASVAKIRINNRTLVVKRYNIKGVSHWLRRCLRPTRAINAWRLAQRLRLFGVATPKPIACIENRFLGLRGKSYFVMDYIEGPHLENYFSKFDSKDTQFLKTAESVVELIHHLSELSITHGDLKARNILVSQHGPVLIDLDGAIEHTSDASFKRAFKHEIARFMKNWTDQPAAYDLFDSLFKIKSQI